MKYEVNYYGGQSRNGNYAVDCMRADCFDTELYAEMVPEDEETGTYEPLKAEIIRQAEAQGIDPKRLQFFYDEDKLEIFVDDEEIEEDEDGTIKGRYWNIEAPEYIFEFTYKDDININLGDETEPWNVDDSETIRRAIRKAVREFKA